jgi:hypothetical protein
MELRNYESRAISYWGLNPNVTMSSPAPLNNHINLSNDQTAIDGQFSNALTLIADNFSSDWPLNPSDGGIFIELSKSEISSFLTPTTRTLADHSTMLIYSIIITIEPNTDPRWAEMANVRLRQARVWLAGAKSGILPDKNGNQHITVGLTQTGRETVVGTDGVLHTFIHDSIEIQSVFYCNKVQSETDCVDLNVYSSSEFAGFFDFKVADFTVEDEAPIGPFADWRIHVESSKTINPGLDLTGVNGVWIEFAGNNQTQIPPSLAVTENGHSVPSRVGGGIRYDEEMYLGASM